MQVYVSRRRIQRQRTAAPTLRTAERFIVHSRRHDAAGRRVPILPWARPSPHSQPKTKVAISGPITPSPPAPSQIHKPWLAARVAAMARNAAGIDLVAGIATISTPADGTARQRGIGADTSTWITWRHHSLTQ